MKKIIKIGVLYLSRLEIENYDDLINISMTSDRNESKVFYDNNFLSIVINIINSTLGKEADVEILEEKEEENE